MTNNNDDFEQHDFNPTEELPPPRGMKDNLAEAWRSRPLFKLVVLMTAVAAVVAASVSFFSGGSSNPNRSQLVTPPSISGAPGGPSSPYMQAQTQKANENREKEALEKGTSAFATPIGSTASIADLNANAQNAQMKELQAEIERMHVEQQQQQQQQARQAQQNPNGQPKEQFDESLAQAMQRQMSQLMDSWTPRGVHEVAVTKDENKQGDSTVNMAGNNAGNAAAAATPANQQMPTTAQPKVLVPAGTVSYAQLLTEANSDVPGPILAQILSGPFAGARAVGQFQISSGYADYLVLQFNLVNFKGKDYPISAIALDPDTTLGGMATDVNQRYFTRVVLPAAAGFLQGFGQAIGQGSSTVTTNGTTTIVSQSSQGYHQGLYQGLGAAASTASQFFQNQANQVKPLVRVEAGTPMGLFFVTSATDNTMQQQPYAGAGYPGNMPYPGMQGGNPYMNTSGMAGYPGMSIPGFGSAAGNQQDVPYPNYATTQRSFSPYSSFPNTGLGGSLYGH